MNASRAAMTAALASIALAAAGCGGSDGGASEAPADQATVRTLDLSGFGEVVADRESKPLYVLTSDPEGGSSCTGSCLDDFDPVQPSGDLTAGPGLEASELTSFDREGGGSQVAYRGRALYAFTGEGLISGAGQKSGSGTFYLVAPDGKPVETTAEGGY